MFPFHDPEEGFGSVSLGERGSLIWGSSLLVNASQREEHCSREGHRRLIRVVGLVSEGYGGSAGQVFRQSFEEFDIDFAGSLGLVPRQYSTGGETTLLGISKRGNRYVRRLIIHGARSCFLHLNRANHALGGWLSALEARTHRNKAVVALANKLTRIVWAILTRPGTVYLQSKGAAVS